MNKERLSKLQKWVLTKALENGGYIMQIEARREGWTGPNVSASLRRLRERGLMIKSPDKWQLGWRKRDIYLTKGDTQAEIDFRRIKTSREWYEFFKQYEKKIGTCIYLFSYFCFLTDEGERIAKCLIHKPLVNQG